MNTSSAGAKELTMALVGRQNAGKTSLMMHLTGSLQRPVNFPGTSVERSEAYGTLDDRRLRVVDLPGISSLNALSADEEVTLEYLMGGGDDRPDLLCAVVDASKLAIELTLLMELRTLGLPVLVALTKNDVMDAEGRGVDLPGLAAGLKLPVVAVHGARGGGIDALKEAMKLACSTPPSEGEGIDPSALARAVQKEPETQRANGSEKIDRLLLHPVWGMVILIGVVFGLFQLIFVAADPLMGLIEDGQGALTHWIASFIGPGALQSLLNDGIVNGVGSVLIFLPQIMILIAGVSLLEGSGYMARAAFILDRVLSRVGLSGRSFVPMVSSFACAVPGILAARMIEQERDRIATIVTAPLMSCSARLPVYVLLIGAFFPVEWAGLVLFGIYALGIVVAAMVAFALRRTVLKGRTSFLLMELPRYESPSPKVIFAQVWAASRAFVMTAGTVIFATAILMWMLSYYPRPAEIHERFASHTRVTEDADKADVTQALSDSDVEALEAGAYLEQSYLARAGKWMQPLFAPAGFDWRITVGILAAFPARELIIPTLGILYRVGEVDPGQYELNLLDGQAVSEGGLRARLQQSRGADGSKVFNPLVAFSLIVFFALCSQCAGTLAAIRRETRSWRWPIFTFGYMTGLAWIAAVLVFQIGTALSLGTGI